MFKLTVLLLLLPLGLFAQVQDSLTIDTLSVIPEYNLLEEINIPEENGGSAKIQMSSKIENLLNIHIHKQKDKRSFAGYRIQIYSFNSLGCDIDKLKELRDNFEETFQDIPAYLKYFDPDFKIRVGNFHSRLESIPTLHRIRLQYPGCYPVKTKIMLEELKRIPMQDILKDETEEGAEDSENKSVI